MSVCIRVVLLFFSLLCVSAFHPFSFSEDPTSFIKANERIQYLRAIRSRRFRITSLELLDNGLGGGTGTGVDTKKNLCSDEDEDPEYEPFYDSLIRFSVTNDYSGDIYIRKVSYRLRNSDGYGRTHRATKLPPLSGKVVPASSTGNEILAYFMEIQGDDKVFIGSDFTLPDDLGFQKVRFVLRGRNHRGERIVARIRTTLSFDNFDRCS